MTGTAAPTRIRPVRPEPVSRTVERRRADGTSLGQVTLAPEIFGIEPNAAVLHQVVTAQLAAARSGTQSTRTRAEVAGGGAKPYKQKGTGRARQGTTRAPQWTGGGVALGPKPRSFRQRTPKKMIRLALCSALSDRAGGNRVALVDEWGFEAPRTKDAASALAALGISGKALVVLDPGDLDAAYSFRNLPGVHIIAAAELNAYDVLRHDWVVFTDTTIPGGTGAEVSSAPSQPRTSTARAKSTLSAIPATAEPADSPGSALGEDEEEQQ
jgi:large subunit ribosomal protein L4